MCQVPAGRRVLLCGGELGDGEKTPASFEGEKSTWPRLRIAAPGPFVVWSHGNRAGEGGCEPRSRSGNEAWQVRRLHRLLAAARYRLTDFTRGHVGNVQNHGGR